MGEVVVFDCDGLLLDTTEGWTRGETALFAAYGREFTLEDKKALLGTRPEATAPILARLLNRPGEEEALGSELLAHCWEEVVSGARPRPGAVQLLDDLHGLAPVGLASNSPSALVREVLEASGLDGVFGVVLGADDVTRPKPAADIYLLACERLGARPQCSVALEDSPTGVASARAAGMYVVGIPSLPGVKLHAETVAVSLADPSVRAVLSLAVPAACLANQPTREVEDAT
jgi:HAD superfamily hydrolase (TIGR01509 family)